MSKKLFGVAAVAAAVSAVVSVAVNFLVFDCLPVSKDEDDEDDMFDDDNPCHMRAADDEDVPGSEDMVGDPSQMMRDSINDVDGLEDAAKTNEEIKAQVEAEEEEDL